MLILALKSYYITITGGQSAIKRGTNRLVIAEQASMLRSMSLFIRSVICKMVVIKMAVR